MSTPALRIQSLRIEGDPQLSCRCIIPNKTPLARLIILHGYGDHAGRHSHVMQAMAEHGIACCALDFRGHGASAGKPGFVRQWEEYLRDLGRFLSIEELAGDGPPVFVLGHSHGGLVAAAAAMRGQLEHCRGVILVAPYLRLKMPVPVHQRLIAAIGSCLFPSLAIKSGLNGPMLTRDQAMIEQGRNDPYCRGIATPRWFTETGRMQRAIRLVPEKFKKPLLLLLPGDDTVADESASVDFFRQCGSSDKTVVHYPDDRHELLRELDREKVFGQIQDWVKQRLGS